MKGKLFILAGQSGVGKNTILAAVIKNHPEFHRVVTYTTRDQRPEEIPGEDHYFVYREKFQEMINNGEFLEYAENHGEMYGTPKDQVENALDEDKNIIMEIDVKGVAQVAKKMPIVSIFIKYEPGDLENLIRQRIKNDPGRGDVSEEEIQRRIATAKQEATYEDNYEYKVINPEGHPEVAIGEVENIIKKEIAN